MGRYTYVASRVDDAIVELNNALSAIQDVTTEFKASIAQLENTRGAQYIDADYSQLYKLQTLAEDEISENIRTIQEKAATIEDYNNAGFFTKLFSSAGMALTKFAEGIVSAGEDLLDGAVSVVGFVGGIFNSEFKNSVAEFVAKDHVGDAFRDSYENGILSDVNKYSIWAHDSTAANIFKGVGTALPYVALSMTGVGAATEAVAAGLSGIGQGTEQGLQTAIAANAGNPDFKAGDVFNSAFGKGLWQGAKNAALAYAMNKLAAKAQNKGGNSGGGNGGSGGASDDFLKLTGDNYDEMAKVAKNQLGIADDVNVIVRKANGAKGDYLTIFKQNTDGTQTWIGHITKSGDDAVVLTSRMAGNQATKVVMPQSSIKLTGGYTPLAGQDDAINAAISQAKLKPGTVVTGGKQNIFDKAKGVADKTGYTNVVAKSDDVINNTIGKPIGWASNKVTGSKLFQAAANSKVGQVITNTVNKHPGAVFAGTAALYTADQIGHSQAGDTFRSQQAALNAATIKDVPVIDEPVGDIQGTIFGNDTPPVETPPEETPPVETPPVETPPVETPPTGQEDGGGGGGGGGYTPQYTPPVETPPVETPPVETPPTETAPTYTPPGEEEDWPTGGDTGGGGYNGEGYTGESSNPDDPNEGYVGDEDLVSGDEYAGSIGDVLTGGNDYVNIPTSSNPITKTTVSTGKKNSVIPIIAGLSAATVAGVGTKAYLDKKEGNEEEDVEAEEWDGDETIDLGYSEENISDEERDYLNPSDEYAYQEEGEVASYEATNNSELPSMQ